MYFRSLWVERIYQKFMTPSDRHHSDVVFEGVVTTGEVIVALVKCTYSFAFNKIKYIRYHMIAVYILFTYS